MGNLFPPDPLNHNVPIVDMERRPTLQFTQQWLKLRGVALALYRLFDDYYTKTEVDARDGTRLEVSVTKRDGTTAETITGLYPVFKRDGSRVDIELQGVDNNQLPVMRRDLTTVFVTMVVR